MKIFIPTTGIRQATEIYTRDKVAEPGAVYETVDVSSDHWAYTRYLEQRWQEGETFVNMEHDIVPFPGAITQIWNCPYNWCFYGYVPDVDLVENGCAPFGLVKFSKDFINSTQGLWRMMREYYDENYEYVWQCHDVFMFHKLVKERGQWKPHQHFPAVFNANPSILEQE